ncbi:response regulator [Stappia sp. F7233]|uniref:histidine kinase n=1 Tax=Stappia albiluteola TaxID=2758565 RepID=A0A839AI94_9HYPH|nr:response regulator [Stappia albiluteola]MBA5778644.1 response regulator [Stappia albiluteola]
MPDTENGAAERSGDTLASLLHDLRTPLAAMRTAGEIVSRDPLTMRQKDALDTLNEAIDALLAMTAEFIAPRSGDHIQEPAGAAIRAVARLFEFAAAAKGLAFSANIDPGLDARLVADSLALRRIISVIVENALKFTQSGTISLEAALTRGGAGDTLVLELHDTGCGVAEEDRRMIFQAHRRGRSRGATDPEAQGSGLGLWNASRLTVLLGGSLELADTTERGSTFRLTVPLQLLPAVDPVAGDALPTPVVMAPDQRKHHILIVDDNATFRRLAATMIEAFGFETSMAESGAEALKMASDPDMQIDAILLDLAMPDMDGVATLAALRTGSLPAQLPVIAMTAAAKPAESRQGMEGFSAVLAKPLDPGQLYAALAEILD